MSQVVPNKNTRENQNVMCLDCNSVFVLTNNEFYSLPKPRCQTCGSSCLENYEKAKKIVDWDDV